MKEFKPKYRIPPTRLPFVNGEIAQVRVRDSDFLVSAIWGGDSGGKLYFWQPETHEHFMRELPSGVPGAYMLKTAKDGRVYIGDGNGDLLRYDPASDHVETLVKGQMHAITWGGCVTDRYAISSATEDACVYDWRDEKFVKKFSPVDEDKPNAQYGHNVLEGRDGKVLLFMDVPQARIVELNPMDMSRRSVTPKGLQGVASTIAAGFIDASTLVVIAASGVITAKVFSYPQYELLADVAPPKGVRLAQFRGAFLDGSYYVVATEPMGMLVRFDVAARKWEVVEQDWTQSDTAYLGTYRDSQLAGVTLRGIGLTYDPQTQKTNRTDLENFGVLEAHAMAVGAEENLIIGAPFINCSFWTIDMQTGKGVDRGRGMPGGGQINQILWDAGRHRAVMSCYTAAGITEYDPEQGGKWPVNPHLVATAESEHQMRPLDLKFDRYFFWMATGPVYGQLGGAISRINCDTGEIKIWRNIVPEQTPNGIVLDLKKHRVYFSTTVFADSDSTPPTQKHCQLVAFDMVTLKVIKVKELPTRRAEARALLPDGSVLFGLGAKYFTWDSNQETIRELGELPGVIAAMDVSSEGTMWGVVAGQIGKINVQSGKINFDPVIAMDGKFLQIADDVMYWTVGTDIYAVPLVEI